MPTTAAEPPSLRRSAYLALRFLLVLAPWTIHLLGADILLSCLLPLGLAFPAQTYELSSRIAEAVWRGVQHICTGHNKANITFSGDSLPKGESAIVISNHVEWSDFYLVQALALEAGMLGRCRWFAKQQLKWVPFLGWGLWAMGMPLVSRRWTEDSREMDRVFHGVVADRWPIWLISYSEATRYSPQKYTETVQWCEANGKPVPKHTLYPRTKGFVATVQNLRNAPHVKAVYDLTLAYADRHAFMSPPSFFQTLYQPNLDRQFRMHVHVRRHELHDLPSSDREIAEWLEARWMEKGKRLASLKEKLANGDPW